MHTHHLEFWSSLCEQQRLMPIAALDQSTLALEWAEFLLNSGFKAIEMTLRTPNSLHALTDVVKTFGQDLTVGAGSILDETMAEQAVSAGAAFIISPGATDQLLHYAQVKEIPWLPGVATLSESLQLREHGFVFQKFFPASTLGGRATIEAWSGPCPELHLCPTGGVALDEINHYLALKAVFMVGASALAPKHSEDDYQARVKAWLTHIR
jgi:2-dehydro-3-deoxyphosphogluconate aldolase/(4S)-4-hydroxy-2-oxoglutarate aldolase